MPDLSLDPQLIAAANELGRSLEHLLSDLVAGPIYRCGGRPAPPQRPGVYVLSEGSDVFHVGRTTNLQRRRQEQTGINNDRNNATFAFRKAAAEAYAAHPDLPKRREDLEKHSTFVPYFMKWKRRVRDMDFRCVEIASAPQRAVFEMLASMALGLPGALWNEH